MNYLTDVPNQVPKFLMGIIWMKFVERLTKIELLKQRQRETMSNQFLAWSKFSYFEWRFLLRLSSLALAKSLSQIRTLRKVRPDKP